MERKIRILYGASHRILRYEEVPLFIAAGFEVVPIKAHWDIFKTYEPGVDDPNHPLYPQWRESCTVPPNEIEKIQAIDLFSYQDMAAKSGRVSKAEAATLNQWIDVIYVPNVLPAVPRILEWFHGITLFRVYGEGKIMTYDEWAAASGADLSLIQKHDARYAAMLMLHALDGPEHKSILGSHVFHVGPCVNRERIVSKWKNEQASRICNTALSYINENPHWTDIYNEFCHLFRDIPLRILGKNNKTYETNKSDERIIGVVENDQEYLELLTDCRCLLDPGTSPFHTHYTPIEAILMDIPVIFLEQSGMGQEILRIIPKVELKEAGMCRNFKEAVGIVKQCLEDIDYAKHISKNQRIIAEKMFSPEVVLRQVQDFASAVPDILINARKSSDGLKQTASYKMRLNVVLCEIKKVIRKIFFSIKNTFRNEF